MEYTNYSNKSAAPALPVKEYTPAPPDYTDIASIKSKSSNRNVKDRSSKGNANPLNSATSPWLVRRTSIHVSSEAAEPFDDDKGSISQTSTATSRRSDKDGGLRHRLFKNGHGRNQESIGNTSSILPWQQTDTSSDTGFGTTVSIEAVRVNKTRAQRRYDMKGLEQAASVKRWAGGGRPGEAWGKLQKDPELWDPSGDTLVYFSYQRPTPSFRVRSTVLEELGSEILTSKLHEGLQPSTKFDTSTASLERDLENMSVNRAGLPRSNTGTHSIASVRSADASEAPVRYRIHFPAPDGCAGQEMLRYHLTTRNFFALLLSRPLVGLTFYQALIDLHQRLLLYLPGDSNCALMIIRCLMQNNLHNVCDDPAAAAGLLAWSEDEDIYWQEGWREGFVHCSGMYAQLRTLYEFRDVSHTSRALLERAHLERQVRVQEAEDHLHTFDFGSIWPENTQHLRPIRSSFDRMQRFLREYYQKAYKSWPPKGSKEGEDTWLTRTFVTRLQLDFDRLYDYLVDTDITWTSLKSTNERHLGLVCSKSKPDVDPVGDDFLAEFFKRFDQKYKNTSIPHPYPLLPSTISMNDTAKQPKSSIFTTKSRILEKRVALAYAEASNMMKPQKASDFAANGLVDAFIEFEHKDLPTEVEPCAARKGRWMLLYAVLQVLSRISVDTPDLYFADNVSYFLNPRLKGTPPWNYGKAQGTVYQEAQGKYAHCWMDYRV